MAHEVMVNLSRDEIMVHLRDDRQRHGREAFEPDIPFLDLPATHESLVEDILLAWEEIVREGSFVGGSEIEGFETEFAGYLGAAECVTVGSGTDALILALRAMGLRPGDEVITVPIHSSPRCRRSSRPEGDPCWSTNLGLRPGAFPHGERWATQGLSLPMYPDLTEEAVARVSTTLADAVLSADVSARRPA